MAVEKSDVYVGSTVRRKVRPHFHRSDCQWATAIKAWNLIQFSSQEEAVRAGYRPCKTCRSGGLLGI